MKRPEGFERRPVPPPPVEPPARSRRVRLPRSTSSNPAVARVAPLHPPTSSAGERRTKPTKRTKPVRADAAMPAKADAARDARREARRAARIRRRFERGEVRRFTRRSRHRRMAWLVTLMILGVMAALIAVGVYSPLLALRTITIDGASRVNAAEVHASVDDQLGTPLALLDYGKLEKSLSSFPLIRSFVTEVVPPDTLVIHLVERAPVASVATASGFEVVDPAGVVIESSAERLPGVPLIDLGGGDVKGPEFSAAVAVLLALPPALLPQVDSVTAHTKDDVSFVLTGAGQRVVWGSPDRAALKAQVLERLIATQSEAAHVEYDVSAPLSAVVRPV